MFMIGIDGFDNLIFRLDHDMFWKILFSAPRDQMAKFGGLYDERALEFGKMDCAIAFTSWNCVG